MLEEPVLGHLEEVGMHDDHQTQAQIVQHRWKKGKKHVLF